MTNQIKSILKRHAIQRKNDLAPIDELALATGLILKTTNLELCPSYLNKLEQLRQAIIKDFVSKAEVKAALIDDPLHLNGITKDDAAINFYSLRGKATKLYDLSDWMEK